MRVPKKITKAWLNRRGACLDQVENFCEEWPDGAALTRENLQRAVPLNVDIWWLAEGLLTETRYNALDQATLPAYNRYMRGTGGERSRNNYRTKVALALADALGLP